MATQNKHPQTEEHKNYQGLGDLFKIRQDLSIVHKVLYIGTVFLGLVLAWYGVWTAVGYIWPLNQPVVAIVAGVVLLLITGKAKDLT